MPARPGIIMAPQPDGTDVAVTLHGDEHSNWVSTPDGYLLARDAAGFLSFARTEGERTLPSDLRYNGPASVATAARAGFVKGTRPVATKASKAAKAAEYATQIEGTFPSKGQHKLLMLLINYADTQPSYSTEDFNRYMNGVNFGGIGSFRDYYLENSYGQLDITSTVTRWITLPRDKSAYGSDGAQTMIMEALALIDNEIDLRDFDNDGDGILDGLAVIHQGTGQEATGNPNEIWSHSGAIYGVEYDGIQIRRYTIQPELLDKGMSTIGVMCHEFGHNLGAPDLYDTDYGNSGGEYPGTGTWDLMGSGAWNGLSHDGTRPAGTNMWQKIQLGWVTPTLLTADTAVRGMEGATFEPVAYRFDTTVPGEYFILENRQQEGNFDMTVPYHGLLIYHVNEEHISRTLETNDLNTTYPQAIYTVCAGAGTEPAASPYTYGMVSSNIAPFPGARNVTLFADSSLPSTKSVSGRYSYKGLTGITENADGTIDFDFICYDTPAGPVNLTATAQCGAIELSWEAPAGETPVCYNVFRNNVLMGTVDRPGYHDTAPANATSLTYAVDAEYASGLISPYVATTITIPPNFITQLQDTPAEGSVTLDWNLSTRLTRLNGDINDFVVDDHTAKSIEVAHRYRAEDLAIYRGYKIRKVAFLPVQSQRVVSCRITVYEGDPVTGELTVASQRNVSEFGIGTWNELQLTRQVEITGDKDLLIAIRYESNNGTVQLLTDRGPALDGYGNCVRINDGEWTTDAAADGNHFLYATLVEPQTATDTSEPDIAPVDDSAADTAVPVGFNVYRDGERLGAVCGRTYVDNNVPGGRHTYMVTNLFKGYNESVGAEISVDVAAGLADIAADTESGIYVAGASIVVTDCRGQAVIADIAGRTVETLYGTGTAVSSALPAGIYLVSTPGRTAKVAVH